MKIRYIIIITLIFVLCVLIPSMCCAKDFKIELQNPKNTKIFFELYWIDHPFINVYSPLQISGGELLPHEIYKLSDKYPTKTKWIIRWFKNEIPSLIFFNVKAGVSKVIIKYKEIVIERGA